ncbi:ABC transporter permease [Aquimarina sp. AD10]|uniref:ABC transporter ATP-binding protein n=1 Tax=Aquimarina aggregata TaxID=1642818 RepID=A0A162CM45_9FLAO|nr:MULTISPECIES: ABC transporter permease [Aquimarina]AXT61179.1 ABC transporter permease [Aquimarina sp. AD10]KZS39274.1 ABC transporter ATP-binding protein [Aquimarina aggregata]RKN02205.1 ABC transporter permease [Aquimarina sp. AD10]
MFDRDRWQEIFEAIGKNKLRTFLSGFTVALGILIFTVLLGLGNGLLNSFLSSFVDDAQNIIFIRAGRTSKAYKGFQENRKIQFENEDFEFINTNYKGKVEYSTPRIYRNGQAKYKKESGSYTIIAVNPEHQYLEKTIMMKGRYINENDIIDKTKNIAIGRLVEKDLFKNEDALGKSLDIDGIAYKIVGVFQDSGGDNEERIICMPYKTVQLLFGNNEKLDQINLTYNMAMNTEQAIAFSKQIEEDFKKKFDVAPDDQSAIRVRSFAEGIKETMVILGGIYLVIFVVGIGTLISGIIGIGNIMTFSIKERTKELGIRKALGASPRSIIAMVLQESVLITSVAGYIGLILGMLSLRLIGNNLEEFFILNPKVETGVIVVATITLIFSGLIAGYIPARRAAKIKPIIALRDE